jgi:predicted PolB exonuclease-like 3'-5' exonuclease
MEVKMIDLIIDIETIPDQAPGALEAIASTITPPGSYKKQESIDKWLADNAETEAEKEWLKTSFNGAKGEIICIGYALGDGLSHSVFRDLGECEASMIQRFYDNLDSGGEYLKIGHNARSFDLRFIFHRSVILGVKPPIDLGIGYRYDKTVFDTMEEWAGWGNRISLVNLCAALGIEAKQGGIDGSNVWDAVKAGRIDEIADYCESDVDATRAAFKKMTFC